MKPKLYIETTIPSYLTAWPSRDLIIAGHQQITKEWLQKRRPAFDIYISQFVIDEAKAGEPDAARERMNAIKEFSALDITEEVKELAARIIASKIIPRKAATDAAHIAVATVHRMDFLMTWNCVHITNAVISKSVDMICQQYGFECPVICTPEELMGE